MDECNIYLSKRKQHLTKKCKNYSNLIINKYIEENVEIDKFKHIIQSYYDKQKKKF